ncbi:mCG9091, isoform CRA_b [Mus musculus]|nr:mCG9091, isoform CRA_b [Mus musculus]
MDSKQQTVRLSDGHFIPILGFGTYAPQEVPKSKATEATKIAIDAGFRHIDSASMYQNEKEVGLAIRSKIADGTVKREDIFYTSKVWCTFHLSNFNRRQLEKILKKPGLKYKPVCNQVECHPYLNQGKLLDFCRSKDIVLVAYSALGSHREKQWVDQSSPVLLDNPVLGSMAKKYNRTPALIALRYQLQRGVVVLAKSFSEKRIKENMQVFEFQLTSEDMKVLDDLNKNIRYISGSRSSD